MKFLDFLEGTLWIILIGMILGISVMACKYDSRTYSTAISYAKEIDHNHFGGETSVERVLPGLYKVTHKDGKVESLVQGYSEENSGYVTFMEPALLDLQEQLNK